MGILKTIEIDYDSDLVEEFLSHYSLMCELMEPLIIKLEREDLYKDSVNELFRIFHNIKSSASYMKLDTITKLAEMCEDVMEEARMLKGPANIEFTDWLLLVSDQFNAFSNDINEDKEYFSILNPKIIAIPTKLDI
ncbi:Hpt domain-containing protein [Campylobacter sputorum]|uniref:Hpt domain-containing protein n=1 Tax=Campylobacter sputorum TaxID=206 RepID=UPI00053BEF3F|nr:Hpt domain-containing protein [Campylobacter sputorum]